MSAPEIRIVERAPSKLPRLGRDWMPAACAAVLLAFRGGAWALPVAVALALATLALAPSLWRRDLRALGGLEAAGLAFLAVYAASGAIGIYRGAAVPAIAHAVLAYAVFRAAAEGEPETQAKRLVTIAAISAGIGVVVSLAAGGPAREPAAWPLVNRDHLASLCAIALPVAIVLVRDVRWAVAAALLATALLFSHSRAGIAAAIVPAALAVALVSRRRAVTGVSATAAAAVLLAISAAPLLAKLASLDVSVSERGAIWGSAWRAFLDRPLTGSGAGSFLTAFAAQRTPEVPYRVDHAHLEPLEIAVESGVAGVAAALVFLVFAAQAVRRTPVSRAAALGVAAVLLHGLADFPLRIPAVAAVAAWALGAAVGAPRESPARWQRTALAALTGVTLFAALHAAGAMLRSPSLSPWNAGVWRARADDARERGLGGDPAALEEARALYSEAIARNPRDAQALVSRARLALIAGDADGALADLEAAVAADPAPPAWQLARIEGVLQVNPDAALRAARELSRARPELHSRTLATLLARLGEDARIVEAATADVPEAHARAASVLLERGFLAEARAHAGHAARLLPGTYASLAASLASEAGDRDAAFGHLRDGLRALGADCEAPAHSRLAPTGVDTERASKLALELSRVAPEPLLYARCAAALAPENGTAWLRVAELTGDRALFQKAADLAPDDPAPLVGLARLEETAGNLQAALAAARSAELRRTCAGTGALEHARLLDANGMRAAAVHRLEELRERCPASDAIARALDGYDAAP